METSTISVATIDSAEEIMEVINQAYSYELEEFKKCKRLLHQFDGGMLELYQRNQVVMNKEPTGEISGVVMWKLIESTENNEKSLYFGPIAVLPFYQGRGIGKRLLRYIDKIAEDLSVSLLSLKVINHKSDLVEFYMKLGYEIVGTSEYPFPDRLSKPSFFYDMQKRIL